MVTNAIMAFREHVAELATNWYHEDQAAAFRHAAFHQITDPNMTSIQVIELTDVDRAGDLEIDGWFTDDAAESIILFQSAGGGTKAPESKVAKFWEAPVEVLNPERVSASRNESLAEIVAALERALEANWSIHLVFASKGGFAPAAKRFASSRVASERSVEMRDGTRQSFICSLELLEEKDIADRFESYRLGFTGDTPEVTLTLESNAIYEVNQAGQRSLRATVPAAEIVRVFHMPSMGYRLFRTNPRGPLANARVNKRIAEALDDPGKRSIFHLMNNGICAVCDNFQLSDATLTAINFQIVNGCQTTVTLARRTESELQETFVDLKLAVADAALAQEIAIASNSQTALRARDYVGFEDQQRVLQAEFDRLQPPWYYEVKQGYWRFVLTPGEKSRFRTGRKRHIEVQPLAQASLAFLGYPSEALDRVRFVFEGIRNEDERIWYERAFPNNVRAAQLLLPWQMLDYLERHAADRVRYSTFHTIWLISGFLRSHYGTTEGFFSVDLTRKLCVSVDRWMENLSRFANAACLTAFRRSQNMMPSPEDLDLRTFFRGTTGRAIDPMEELDRAFRTELELQLQAGHDPTVNLPVPSQP